MIGIDYPAPSPSPYDSQETIWLREQIKASQRARGEAVRAWNEIISAQRKRYAEQLRRQRPQYPTPQQVAGLVQAAGYLREGSAYGDHYGYPSEDDREKLADRVVAWSNKAYRPARLAGGTLEQIANHLKGQDDECGAGQL